MSTASVMEREPIPQEELFNRDNFWSNWGEKSGLSEEQFDAIWSEAQERYVDLPYHAWLHARRVLWGCMMFADEFEARGMDTNRRVLVLAALDHDALFYEKHKEQGFDCKEALSETVFEKDAVKHGYSPEEISLGKGAIMTTKAGVPATTIYDIILDSADLFGAADDFDDVFMPDGERLFEEWNIVNIEHPKTPEEYADFSIQLLSTYVVVNLGTTELLEGYDPRAFIIPGIVSNITRKATMRAEQNKQTLQEYAEVLGGDVPAALDFALAA